MHHSHLRAAGLPVFPCWTRYNHERNRWDKGPAVPRGVSWKQIAANPGADASLDWSSGVVGVMIPPGVLILDLDSYKGSTRESVEQHFGCRLPWDRAKIQQTIGGGEHYAFAVPLDADLQQVNSPDQGFDTRAAGKGFICAGEGYTAVGAGVYALACPASLPALPAPVLDALTVHRTAPEPTTRPADGSDTVAALHHVDPGCDRATWVRLGCALRDAYRDEPDAGLGVFRAWSAGQYWPAGCPENHDPDVIDQQWNSFKPDGAVHAATLFYAAIAGGWQPPASFDAGAAFGNGAATPGVFNELVERIRRDGCDIKQTESIMQAIQGAGCNPLQIGLLVGELKTELGNRREINKVLDKSADPPPDQGDGYGASDVANANWFLARHYPNGRLIRLDGELYHHDGRIWRGLDPNILKHQVGADMAQQKMQNNRMNSCIEVVQKLAPASAARMNQSDPHLVVFENGMLDTLDGTLYAHYQPHLSTILLPYGYDPAATCPRWSAFLADVFDGDRERITLLQEWAGYQMTVDYTHHKVMMLIGPARCGKGTIGRVLQQIVGPDNFSGGSLSSLARDSFIQALCTRSVLFIGDAEKRISGTKLPQVIERIKSISGNDAVDFDRKFLSSLSTTLPTRLTIAANSVPALFDDSGALASRMLVIPFRKSYLGREDLTLFDRLSTELPGIANWALQGLARLRQAGRFTEPEASREETDYLRETYSPVTRFIGEACTFSVEASITSASLYDTYRTWATNENEKLLDRRPFVSAFRDATRDRDVKYGMFRIGDTQARGFRGVQAATLAARAFAPQLVVVK